jgi:hypothetical protein
VSLSEPAQVVGLPARRRCPRPFFVSLRPRQWTKNLLLFAGIIFAAKLGDASRWLEALAAFVAYCAASSASYLVNDVRDAPHDRVHPVKRSRPIARGELSPRAAEALAIALLLVAFALVVPLGLASILFLCAFFALQAAYTLSLKHVVLLDVMTIGGLFVIRAAAERGGGRRTDLAVAAAVYRSARPLPRVWRSAAASSCSSARRRRRAARSSRGIRSRSSTSS